MGRGLAKKLINWKEHFICTAWRCLPILFLIFHGPPYSHQRGLDL